MDNKLYTLNMSKVAEIELKQLNNIYYKNWIAIYIYLFHEQKIDKKLTSLEIEHYVFEQKKILRWNGKYIKIKFNALPRIIFIHPNRENKEKISQFISSKYCEVLKLNNKPFIIPDDKIKRLKHLSECTNEETKSISMRINIDRSTHSEIDKT